MGELTSFLLLDRDGNRWRISDASDGGLSLMLVETGEGRLGSVVVSPITGNHVEVQPR
jgi:hypothetical protein